MTENHSDKKQKIYLNKRWLGTVKHLPPHEAFQFLKNCNCCEDHQVDKPQELVIWDDFYNGKGEVFTIRKKPCVCDCRHIARFLCRGVDISQIQVVDY